MPFTSLSVAGNGSTAGGVGGGEAVLVVAESEFVGIERGRSATAGGGNGMEKVENLDNHTCMQ